MKKAQKLKNKSCFSAATKLLVTASYLTVSSASLVPFSTSLSAMKKNDAEMGINKTEVGHRRWKKEVDSMTSSFRAISITALEEDLIQRNNLTQRNKEKINIMVEKQVNKWEKAAKSFFASYKNIHSAIKRSKNPSNAFFDPLFDFVVEFEAVYDSIRIEYTKRSFTPTQLEDSFLVFQTVWNSYMAHYQAAAGKELSQVTPLLGYSKKHSVKGDDGKDKDILKHLACLHDSNGIILFTIFPHGHIQENLYRTYVPYARAGLDLLEERSLFFYDTGDEPIIVDNSGVYVVREEGHLAFAQHIGREGALPFVSRQGWLIGLDYKFKNGEVAQLPDGHEDDIPTIGRDTKAFHLKTSQHEIITNNMEEVEKMLFSALPPKLESRGVKHMASIENYQRQLIKHADRFFLSLLKDGEKDFIAIPKGPTENLEAQYILLLDYIEKQKESQDDADLLYVQAAFPGTTIEEALLHLETAIVENAVREEQEKIDAENAEKEKDASKAKLDTSTKSKKHKRRGQKGKQKEKIFKKHSVEKEKEGAKDENQNQVRLAGVSAKTKKRLQLLKNKEIRKNMKYSKYLKLVNMAVQGLREAGIPASAALNAGSHGYLTVGDQTLPLCRPHGGRDTITADSAQSTINTLLDVYFGALRGQKGEKEK